MKTVFSILACLSLAYAGAAHAQSTINFDDITVANFFTSTPVPNGYYGLNWNNFVVDNTTAPPIPSGYLNGTVSTPNVALNAAGNPASISAVVPFTLGSGYFTSAFNNGLTLEVTGFNGTTTQYDNTYSLNTSGPLLIDFPSFLVTEVDFTASGGVNAGYQGYGPIFALDNLTVTVVPEPSVGLMFCGSIGLIVLMRRKELLISSW